MTFADKIELLGRVFSASCTSWGRTPKRNAAVGGAHNSRHLDWLGADLVPDQETNYIALGNVAKLLGLVVIIEKNHLHVHEPR